MGGSGYTDDEDDDDMDDADYNKDLRHTHRVPLTTSALSVSSPTATTTPKATSASNEGNLRTADNDEDMRDEFDGVDSDDLESAIPQKEVRGPTLLPNKGKVVANVAV